MPALSLECLRVEANGRRLLNCVSLRVEPGQLALVAGPSGAGLARSVFGLAVSGRIRVAGLPAEEAAARGLVGYVPQEPWSSLLTPYVESELALAGVPGEIAGRLGLDRVLLEPTATLSAGEAQRLALAIAAYAGEPAVLLVDEVTAYVDEDARVEAAKLLRRVADEGRAVVVVDHNLELWRGLADSVVYLERGRATAYSSVEEVPLYPAGKLALRRARELSEKLRGFRGSECECLRAEDVWFRYPGSRGHVLRGVSLEAACGSVTVIVGKSGRGKTTLLKVLAGLYRPEKGRVARRRRPHYVPENPLLYLSEPTAGEELGWDLEAAKVFGLEHVLETPIGALSSGERRRLALASAVRRGAGVILVDEPTVGLDYSTAVSVVEALASAAEKGAAVVVATHSRILRELAQSVVEL
ncbi:MAG: ATP-binding cassette domain-containing protein [Thermoproteota archaeon]